MTDGDSARALDDSSLGELAKDTAILAAGASLGATAGVIAGMTADMGRIKTLAKDQGFAVDENTGDALISAVDAYLKKWAGLKGRAERLKNGLPLGSDPYAKQVTLHTGEQARDAFDKLEQLEATLETFVEAIRIAKSNYAKMDDQTVQQFKTSDYV